MNHIHKGGAGQVAKKLTATHKGIFVVKPTFPPPFFRSLQKYTLITASLFVKYFPSGPHGPHPSPSPNKEIKKKKQRRKGESPIPIPIPFHGGRL
jgi:hypothetical protein